VRFLRVTRLLVSVSIARLTLGALSVSEGHVRATDGAFVLRIQECNAQTEPASLLSSACTDTGGIHL
jgi:hypothetical protein